MTKKLIITDFGQGVVLRELEVAGPSTALYTEHVIRERPATTKEILLYHSGYGRMINFDKPAHPKTKKEVTP